MCCAKSKDKKICKLKNKGKKYTYRTVKNTNLPSFPAYCLQYDQ